MAFVSNIPFNVKGIPNGAPTSLAAVAALTMTMPSGFQILPVMDSSLGAHQTMFLAFRDNRPIDPVGNNVLSYSIDSTGSPSLKPTFTASSARSTTSQTTLASSSPRPIIQYSDGQLLPLAHSSGTTKTSSSFLPSTVPTTTISLSATPSATPASTMTPSQTPTSAPVVAPTLSAGARAGLGIGVTLTILLIFIALLALTLRRRYKNSQLGSSENSTADLEGVSHSRTASWWQKGEKGIVVQEIVELEGDERGGFELEGDTNHRRKTAVELSTSHHRFSQNKFQTSDFQEGLNLHFKWSWKSLCSLDPAVNCCAAGHQQILFRKSETILQAAY
ncbi:MAG: hypothetical protein M1835_007311 [Candelina submexicana]|nr:MAG: hypothetical protein M1835_007311 [Candelina submexicana]